MSVRCSSALGTSSISGAVRFDVALPIAGATQRVWSSFLEDLDFVAAARLLQLALEKAVEDSPSLDRKNICEGCGCTLS